MIMSWPTRLIDRESSWAVLVGASEYSSALLCDVPQAVTSVEDLKRALAGEHGLFREEQVLTVTNPRSVEDVLGPLDKIAGQKPDVVLFYYVGHGMQDSLDAGGGLMQLFLTLHGSVDAGSDRIRTGLPASAVFSRLRSLRAKQSVVVLDCCFAGRGLDDPSAGDVHVLCATGKTTQAGYGLTDRHTGFTGTLLRLFEHGIPDGPPYLDLHTIFHRLSVVLPTTPCDSTDGFLPSPRQRATDLSGSVAFVRNPAFGTALTSEGIAARVEFARRVASHGSDPLLPAGEQRMLLAHANDLFTAVAADTVGP